MFAPCILTLYVTNEVLLLVYAQGSSNCPHNWLNWNGSCYGAYSTKKSWNDSLTFCQENQADLASLNSAAENQFVYGHMALKKSVWIGLVKDKNLGVFRWTNGENVNFDNWIRTPVINENEDCGEMTDYGEFHGMWNDNLCSRELPFICEKAELQGQYFKKIPRKQLIHHVITAVTVLSDLECLFLCSRHGNCSSVNMSLLDTQSTALCELNGSREAGFPGDLTDNEAYDYFELLM
ncbi:C-type lectin APL-like isoform X5 [Montipora capricornis]|uniref:C-type lectin APL-like isoform X2 n=1 Tax=Montipora capricornis TaxID=246305 RepID=UPI0035F1FF75